MFYYVSKCFLCFFFLVLVKCLIFLSVSKNSLKTESKILFDSYYPYDSYYIDKTFNVKGVYGISKLVKKLKTVENVFKHTSTIIGINIKAIVIDLCVYTCQS